MPFQVERRRAAAIALALLSFGVACRVVYAEDNANARDFAEWLTRGAGRAAMDGYRIAGTRAFTPWPEGCADTRPQDLPCSCALSPY